MTRHRAESASARRRTERPGRRASGGDGSGVNGSGADGFGRPQVQPTVDDHVVEALSEPVGGPIGTRAGRHPWWTPVRVVLALTALAFALGMVQKQPCAETNWNDGQQRYAAHVLLRPALPLLAARLRRA